MNDERVSRFEEFTGLTWRGLALIAVPSLALVAGSFLAGRAVHGTDAAAPHRPRHGPEGSAVHALGQRYRAVLAKSGITVEVRATRGPGENVGLLAGAPQAWMRRSWPRAPCLRTGRRAS